MLEIIVGFLGAAVIGGIGWAVQLNSRVAVLEANMDSLKELIESQFEDVKNRLVRIENNQNGKKG